MKKIVVGSLNRGAGKTSMIVGIAKALGAEAGYMKPFGDRLLYKKKRLWDHDSAVVTALLGLSESPEDMTVGFEHSKLRFMFDEKSIGKKLLEMADHNGGKKKVLFVEGPATLSCGISVHLDPFSLAKYLSAKLILVVSGQDDAVLDKLAFLKKRVQMDGADLAGVIINKVQDTEDFEQAWMPAINELGVRVLGTVPAREELGLYTAGFVADALFAKVLAGQNGITNRIKRVFVGAMTVNAVLQYMSFKSEHKKLVITSGDRSDMVLASLETGASAVLLTNGILPEPMVISKAESMNVPLLLTSLDTFSAAKKVDDMEVLLSRELPENAELLADLVKKHLQLDFV